jgi:hypothetical protein
MQKFLKLSVGLSDNQTTTVSAGSLIFALGLQPIYGALSDRIGRGRFFLFRTAMKSDEAVDTSELLCCWQESSGRGGFTLQLADNPGIN